jgi:hypothetical protein
MPAVCRQCVFDPCPHLRIVQANEYPAASAQRARNLTFSIVTRDTTQQICASDHYEHRAAAIPLANVNHLAIRPLDTARGH